MGIPARTRSHHRRLRSASPTAQHSIMLADVSAAQDELLVLDATGRAVVRYQHVVPADIPVGHLNPGRYHAVVLNSGTRPTAPFVVVR